MLPSISASVPSNVSLQDSDVAGLSSTWVLLKQGKQEKKETSYISVKGNGSVRAQ